MTVTDKDRPLTTPRGPTRRWASNPRRRRGLRCRRGSGSRTTTGWVARWHEYAQLLRGAAGVGDPADRCGRRHAGAAGLDLDLVYTRLDTERTGTGRVLGEKLVNEVLLPALRRLYEDTRQATLESTHDRLARESIHAWY